jgi:hypothetical protein
LSHLEGAIAGACKFPANDRVRNPQVGGKPTLNVGEAQMWGTQLQER